MKKLKAIIGVLASSLMLGAAVGISSIHNNQEAQPVEAATTVTVYYAVTTTYTVKCNVCVKYNSESDQTWYTPVMEKTTSTYNSKPIYKVTYTDLYDGARTMQFQLYDGDTWKSQVIPFQNSWTAASTFNGKIWTGSAWTTVYSVNIYTNGGKGSDTTQYKVSGVTYTIPTYDSVNIGAGGGRHAVKWNTKSNGSGTSYQPGDNYTSNANLDLYFIQDWYTFQFKINSGSWITLTKTDDTPSGYVGQFVSAITSFTSGDSITFQKKYSSETPISITPSYDDSGSNIVAGSGSTSVVLYSTDGKIYLKVTNDNGHTVYAEGHSERGIVISRGGHEYKCACTKDSNTQWEVSHITLLPGDTLKATYGGGAGYTIWVENYEGYEGSVFGITSGGLVSTPGVYKIYLKSYDDGKNFPNVYLAMEDDNSAKLIAQTFNTALTTVCTSTAGGGATSQITTAFSTQRNYYNHLTSTCKTKVATASTSDTDITTMRTKYDYIVGKYGTTIAPDYLGRNPVYFGGALGFAPLATISESNNGTSAIVIIAVSAISVTAIGGYFFLRKRKQER